MVAIKQHTARIGLMVVGLGNYWEQFPGMKEGVMDAHRRLGRLLEGQGEIAAAGLVDSVAAARKAEERFVKSQVDIVFCHLGTYANSETLLPAVASLDVPIILLNVQPVKALDLTKVDTIADWLGVGVTCAGLPEMTAVLLRSGKRFATVTGHLENDAILDRRLLEWCSIATLRRRLVSQSIALLGRPYAGMLDLNVDETRLQNQLGPYIHHLDWDDIIAELANVTDSDKEHGAARIESLFDFSASVTQEEIDSIAVFYSASRRFVSRYNLCAIASHFEGEPSGKRGELLAALNPVLSLLMADGIACPVEGDIKAGIAMLILKSIAGSATLAELYSMDFEDDICFIGHSGAGDPAISARKPSLAVSEVFHGKSGKGYLTQFYPETGPVTLVSVTQDERGDYRMIAAEGVVEDGPTLRLGDTNCRVRFSCGLRDFVEQWSSYGPTHHGALCIGSHLETLGRVSVGLGIPLETVC